MILGIETSCDDTSVAVVDIDYNIKSSIVSSQVKFHQKYGGVVPEIASRHHLTLLNPIINEALGEAGCDFGDIEAVAVTNGPGLVGALLIGLSAAKAVSLALNIPLITVNHLEGHIFANFLEENIGQPRTCSEQSKEVPGTGIIANPRAWNQCSKEVPGTGLILPFICLIVSGGHTSIILVKAIGDYETLGQTVDDAAGEAYDKVAKFLGLGYPGGPIVEEKAKKSQNPVNFTRPMLHSGDYNFSFSGIKTAVIYYINKTKRVLHASPLPAGRHGSTLPPSKTNDICAGFQEAVSDVLVTKTIKAALENNVKTVAIAGGVSANSYLRERFSVACEKQDLRFIYPRPALCTDNAAMVCAAAIPKLKKKEFADLNISVDANLSISSEK